MQINKLIKFYGASFKDIFKSITFDNGNEFSRWKDMEVKPNTKEKRTKIYFGRPYHSCDRASNENCNGLIRYFIKKDQKFDDCGKNDDYSDTGTHFYKENRTDGICCPLSL